MTAPTTSPNGAPGIDSTPGIDIVFSTSPWVVDAIFDDRTLKLIGSLHRRFWDRRRKMLLSQALRGDDGLRVDLSAAYGDVVADLRSVETDWVGRLEQFLALRTELLTIASVGADSAASVPTVRVRGWGETEAGILVDGRAVPGCVFDIVIAMTQGAELLRANQQAFVIDVPEAADDQESKLWADLVCLAEDRLGIERGTVVVVACCDPETQAPEALAVA